MEKRRRGAREEREERGNSAMIDKRVFSALPHIVCMTVQMQTFVSSAVSRTIFCCSSVSAC